MDEMTIYWITRLDAFKCLINFLGFASFISAIVFGIISVAGSYDNYVVYDEKLLRCFKHMTCISLICCAVFSLMNCFLPSTKEMFAIKCIPAIASKENVEKLKAISNDMLDATAAYIEDLKKNK